MEKMKSATVLLYKIIILQEQNLFHNSTLNTILSSFQGEEQFQYRDKKGIVEIKSIDDASCFGFIGLLHNLNMTQLSRLRNPDMSIEEKLTLLLENYTYFFVNFKNNRLAVIKNYNLPNFDNLFMEIVQQKLPPTATPLEFQIKPQLVDDIESYLQSINEQASTMKFYIEDPKHSAAFLSMDELGFQDLIQDFQLKLNMKAGSKSPNYVKKIMELCGFSKKASLKSRNTTTDTYELVDFFTKVLTKSVLIPIFTGSNGQPYETEIRNTLMKLIAS